MCRQLIAALALLALALLPGEALAAKKKPEAWELPMAFTHVRASGACEPTCPEWIVADGKITPGTSKRFKAFLKSIGDAHLPVILQSAGGDVNSALALGRIIRDRKMDVAVGYTVFIGCAPRQDCKPPKAQNGIYRGMVRTRNAYCNSACPLVLAGGIRRIASADVSIGVHQVTTTWQNIRVTYRETYQIVDGKKKIISRKEIGRKKLKPKVTQGMYADLKKKLLDYYSEMGVDPGLIDEAEKTPPSKLGVLSEHDLKGFRMVTGMDGALSLAAPDICNGRGQASNCITSSPKT
ncbi:MAG: hypothetical protein LCH46_11960 [Proteobacteria bacterium]|nr:hypothetical protein [Pseudomonadota bacterium]